MKALGAVLIIAVFLGGLGLGRWIYRTHKLPEDGPEIAAPPLTPLEPDFFRRTLFVLVDGSDVYCGEERAPKKAVEEYICRTMELNHAKQFVICGTDTARYGDVVALIGKLQKRGLKLATVTTITIPSGTRLPVVGRDPNDFGHE